MKQFSIIIIFLSQYVLEKDSYLFINLQYFLICYFQLSLCYYAIILLYERNTYINVILQSSITRCPYRCFVEYYEL